MSIHAMPGFVLYNWNTGAGVDSIRVSAPGLYTVQAQDLNGCKSADSLVVLSLHPLPIINLGADFSLCANNSKVLSPGNFKIYKWNDGSSLPTLQVKNIGTYAVRVTNQFGCSNSDSVQVKAIHPLPVAFLAVDTAICNYESIRLHPLSSFNQYLWSTGETVKEIIIKSPGRYSLQVRDQNNCVGKDTIVVNLKDCMNGFYLPTAFTPNRDRINDSFKPLLFGKVVRYEFSVFNRYGQKVFFSSDKNMGWNGTVGGLEQNTQTFTWVCLYQFEGERSKLEKGSVILIK